jgi:hypothetical protein
MSIKELLEIAKNEAVDKDIVRSIIKKIIPEYQP